MKYFYLLVGLLAAYVLIVVFRFIYKVNNLPILPTINHVERTVGSGIPLRYVAGGDSTSVGVGASSVSATYVGQILDNLAKTHEVTFKNVGVSGANTQDLINTQLQQIISFNPDVVTISIGANDATHLLSRAKTLANLKLIISELTSKTTANIYLANTPNFREGKLLPAFYIMLLEYRDFSLNQNIERLETSRVKIANVHDFTFPESSDRAKTFAADNFHPNDTGYRNWTGAFLKALYK